MVARFRRPMMVRFKRGVCFTTTASASTQSVQTPANLSATITGYRAVGHKEWILQIPIQQRRIQSISYDHNNHHSHFVTQNRSEQYRCPLDPLCYLLALLFTSSTSPPADSQPGRGFMVNLPLVSLNGSLSYDGARGADHGPPLLVEVSNVPTYPVGRTGYHPVLSVDNLTTSRLPEHTQIWIGTCHRY
jgi:hypothetical protein